jgi:hypothetical protein
MDGRRVWAALLGMFLGSGFLRIPSLSSPSCGVSGYTRSERRGMDGWEACVGGVMERVSGIGIFCDSHPSPRQLVAYLATKRVRGRELDGWEACVGGFVGCVSGIGLSITPHLSCSGEGRRMYGRCLMHILPHNFPHFPPPRPLSSVLKMAVLPVLRMHARIEGEEHAAEAEEWDEERMWREFDMDGDGGITVREWQEGLDKVRAWCEIPTVTMIGLCDSVFAPILRETHGGAEGRRLSRIIS